MKDTGKHWQDKRLLVLLYIADLAGVFLLGYFELPWYGWLISLGLIMGSSVWLFRVLNDVSSAEGPEWSVMALHKELLASLQEAVVLTELTGEIVYVNPLLERLTGYQHQELLGKSPDAFLLATNQASLAQVRNQVLQDQVVEAQWEVLHKNGDKRWAYAKVSLWRMPATEQRYMLSTLRDITQEVHRRGELQGAKDQFEFFVESLPHLMWVATAEGQVEFANRRARKALEINDQSPYQKRSLEAWLAYVHEDDLARVHQALIQANKHPQLLTLTLRLRGGPEQQYRWFELNYVPQIGAQGQLLKWYGVCTEIDALVRSQQQLDERERFYRSVVESQTTFLVRADTTGTCLYGNPAFQQTFFPSGMAEDQAMVPLVHPDDWPTLLDLGQQSLEAMGQRFQMVMRMQLPQGTWAYTEWEFLCQQDHSQAGIYFQAIGQDITERYVVEQVRDALALVVEHTDHGVCMVDANWQVQWVNPAFTRMSGYELAEVKGQHLGRVFARSLEGLPHDQALEQTLFADLPRQAEVLKYTKEGAPYWAEVYILPIHDEPGPLEGYVTLERDITERKLQSLALDRNAQELTLRNQRLQDFTYMVSHNLRAPMANLKGMAAIVAEELAQNQVSEAIISHFDKAIHRMDQVIEGMQHALSTDDAEETLRELHWLELFRDIVDQLKLDIQAAAMKWEVDFGKAPVVRGPWSDLHSILYNLLSNAIKYRADKRPLKVAIHTQLVGPQLVLTVKDNGRGIDLDAVGDRLFQARARFHDEEEGTGMGLYLVKQHVKALGGTIDVESRPDQGTSFRVFLPHAEA